MWARKLGKWARTLPLSNECRQTQRKERVEPMFVSLAPISLKKLAHYFFLNLRRSLYFETPRQPLMSEDTTEPLLTKPDPDSRVLGLCRQFPTNSARAAIAVFWLKFRKRQVFFEIYPDTTKSTCLKNGTRPAREAAPPIQWRS